MYVCVLCQWSCIVSCCGKNRRKAFFSKIELKRMNAATVLHIFMLCSSNRGEVVVRLKCNGFSFLLFVCYFAVFSFCLHLLCYAMLARCAKLSFYADSLFLTCIKCLCRMRWQDKANRHIVTDWGATYNISNNIHITLSLSLPPIHFPHENISKMCICVYVSMFRQIKSLIIVIENS